MTRRALFMPLMAVVLAGAALALLLGGRAATTTETDAIERVAAQYLEEGGAARTDCRARPAQSEGLWLVVICEDAGGRGAEYFVDRFGRVADRRTLDGEA